MATTPQNDHRNPTRKRPVTSAGRSRRPGQAPYGRRDVYSRSAPRDDRWVDISSYSNKQRSSSANARQQAYNRRRQEEQVHYHDGFAPEDTSMPQQGYRPAAPARRRKKRRHPVRRVLCILLALLVVVFSWLTYLFTNMDRTHNTIAQSTYERTPKYAPTWPVQSSPWVTNVLLIGIDQDPGGTHRSDSMILVSIDRLHQKLRMVSFLRDTYAEIPNHGRQKLNAAFAYGGPSMVMQTLENNFRIQVDQYIAADFNAFSKIITDIGGIDVTLNQGLCKQFNENLHTNFTPGKYTLKGEQALYYTRIRNYGNDYGRAQRQREVIGQLLKKLVLSGPIKMNSLLKKIMPMLWTNIPAYRLAEICMLNVPSVFSKQQTRQIPADNTFVGKNLSSAGWVEVTDMEKNCTLLRQFLYAEGATGGQGN